METLPGLEILHVVASAAFGGLEAVVQSLSQGLARRGHRVRVVAVLDPDPEPQPFETALDAAGVEVLPLRLPVRAYGRERRELRSLLQRLRPQVVHSHGYRADIQAGFAARRAGLPQVSTVHGFTGGGWRMRLYERLQERALARAEAVVAVSEPLRARLVAHGIAPDRLHLLRNAWRGRGSLLDRAAARRTLGLPPEGVVVGWVGRLSREKGADVLLEALPRLAHRPIQLCVVGDGALQRPLEVRAAELAVGSRVHWCGPHPEAASLFAAFDAFVLSSRTEGTPIVLLEAMDAGVPIVATRVGGVPDVVGREEAWLVEPETPAALADALGDLLDRPEEASRRVENARRRLCREFPLDPWLDSYEDVYASVTRGQAARRGAQ